MTLNTADFPMEIWSLDGKVQFNVLNAYILAFLVYSNVKQEYN